MGTGIGKYCKRCGEQLNYDDGFEDGFCNRCYHIVKFEAEKAPQRVEYEKRIKILGELSGSKPRETEHIKLHKEVFCGVKPKEEEEWERELRFTYGHLYYQNEEGEFCQIVNEIDDLIDFISQLLSEEFEKGVIKGRLEALPIAKELLSERTFNREELEIIKGWYDRMFYSVGPGKVGPGKKDKLVHDKLSKLLKEKK